jgi:hypothetical protein
MPVIKSKLQEKASRKPVARASSIAQAAAEAAKALEKSRKSQGDTLYSEAIYPLRYATLNRKLSICAWSGLWL